MLPFIIAVSGVLAIQTMIPFGLERQLSRVYVVAGVGSLALSLPLIHSFGAAGASAAVLTVETTVVFAMAGILRRHGIHLLVSQPPVLAITQPELEAKA